MTNYIKISGPVTATTGPLTIIDASDFSIVAEAIEYSQVLNTSNSTPSTSHLPIPVVFAEMKNYVENGMRINNYTISEDGRTISW
ncbi:MULTISPECIES: hypothetical protein [unclassified Exiguobacterium]|uniref:hypothetical protein n=1 Tax=unclassified Exiguobacterium TaxID=2644629 RepID=UPI001BE625B2|nr:MULTISPECIES: hypothetical protein [unclassified Exiguobacterium]